MPPARVGSKSWKPSHEAVIQARNRPASIYYLQAFDWKVRGVAIKIFIPKHRVPFAVRYLSPTSSATD